MDKIDVDFSRMDKIDVDFIPKKSIIKPIDGSIAYVGWYYVYHEPTDCILKHSRSGTIQANKSLQLIVNMIEEGIYPVGCKPLKIDVAYFEDKR